MESLKEFHLNDRATINRACNSVRLFFNVNEWMGWCVMSKWIGVNDKLPEYGVPVLLCINGVVQNMTWCRDGSDDSNDWFELCGSVIEESDRRECAFFIDYENPVYWMPLPEPLK